MTAVVIDASVWVAYLAPCDTHHPAVKAWLTAQRAAGTLLISPAFFLVEVAGAVARRTGEPDLTRRAVAAHADLPDVRLAALDADLLAQAGELTARLGLRGADALYVAVADHLHLPLATLDEDQRRRAGVILQCVEIG